MKEKEKRAMSEEMRSEVFSKLQEDIRKAMVEKDTVKRDCLRFIVSDIKNLTVNAGKEVTDEACLKAIQKSVKTHSDSIEQFEKAGRSDLVEKEKAELVVLQEYMPKMLSEEETKLVIDNILQTVEAVKKNFGIIMKQLPREVEKKIASKILNGLLK